MRILLLLCSMLFCAQTFAYDIYVSVGAAYKFNETYIVGFEGTQINTADTAQFEVGVQEGNLSYGFRHVSNWSKGWPVNDEDEYVKDELFIEYRFNLSDL